MKTVLLKAIRFYQGYFSPSFRMVFGVTTSCRHKVSCSEFAISAIKVDGALKGSYRSLQRVISCSPFGGKND